MNELIVVEQLPVIREQLKSVSKKIDAKVKKAESLACTEETVKDIKKVRAVLNKEFTEIEEQKKQVRDAVMKPYLEFEAVYNECISGKYKAADFTLKHKITAVEDGLKKQKEQEIKWYFEEYQQFKMVDFVTYEQAGINVTLSASIKNLNEQAKAYIDRIADDLEVIKVQEYPDEVLYEYKRNLNLALSISNVKNRHDALEREKERQEERRKVKAAEAKAVEIVEEFVVPVVEESEPIGKITFEVIATVTMLRELKQFLENGGYEYEQLS